MMKQKDYHVFPEDLNAIIISIGNDMKTILGNVTEVVRNEHVRDAADQLNDVLESSDNVANIIIDCAVSIQVAIQKSNAPIESKKEISKSITRIYEACSFQDPATQRIKKVLRELASLEEQFAKLNNMIKDYIVTSEIKKPPFITSDEIVLDGPQLPSIALSQDDVDSILSTASGCEERTI